MTVKKMFMAIYGVTIFFLAILAGLTVLMLNNQHKLNYYQEIRFKSYLAADELKQSSDDLTRLCRTYVATKGDKKYEDRYWEILDIRNGKKPRPDGRTIPLRQIMQKLGFTAEEFAKLKEAENNSNDLVRTETVAFNAVKGKFDDGTGKFTIEKAPDYNMALRIMFDAKYHSDKASIMSPIDDFFKLLDARTKQTVNTYEKTGNYYLIIILSLVAVIIGICISSYYLIHFKVVRPLKQTTAELRTASEELKTAAQQQLTSTTE